MNCKICGKKSESQFCVLHKPRKPLNKKPINKISDKGKIKKEEKKEIQKEDWLFYDDIWHHRLHICEHCEKWIGNDEPLTTYFDHILEKSKHPHLRHVKENIWLLCPDCHSAKTNGYLTQKMKDKIEQTKKLLL